MIDDERGIVVVLLQKSNHYSSYIINHQKVFPYTNDTFYGADPYCILKLLVNCSVFSLLHKINLYTTEIELYGGLILDPGIALRQHDNDFFPVGCLSRGGDKLDFSLEDLTKCMSLKKLMILGSQDLGIFNINFENY